MGKILRVDLSTGSISSEDSAPYRERFLGGRGVGAWILLNECEPSTDALDPANPIVINTGTLTGSSFIGSGKIEVETKNYNTGGINFGMIGGFVGPELRWSGWDHVVITGKAEHPVYLYIHDDEVEIRNASHIWGTDTWTAEDIIRWELEDEDIPVLGIGQAGERLLHQSALITNKTRCTTSGGIGAVWGAKNLKAIAVRASVEESDDIPSSEAFESVVKEKHDKLQAADSFEGLQNFGVFLAPVALQNDNDAYPYRGTQGDTYENLDESPLRLDNWPRTGRFCKECYGCILKCGQVEYQADEGPFKGTTINAPENNLYYSFGTRLDMRSPSNVIKAYELCSRYGFDGDQVAVSISWAFELYEYGIIDSRDTDGLELVWGNDLAVIALIRQIVDQRGFGKLLSLGTEEAAKVIGKGSEYYITANKHQDNLDTQRVSKGWALGNNISLRGGKHLDGAPFELVPGDEDLAEALFGVRTAYTPTAYDGKGKLVSFMQRLKAVVDSIGGCWFTSIWMDPAWFNAADFADIANAALGADLTVEDYLLIGERIINVEKAFNTIHAGFTRQDDLPPKVYTERTSTTGHHKDELLDPGEYGRMLDEYYDSYGWNAQSSWQSEQRLIELGLPEVADKLRDAKLLEG